ncbi:hypothetical protein PISMIDRAFT_411719 [Pisolithus microcarpus 441]|uniref:Unplaced genomic scaffold scaffold_324, whole genome shotgun sequence n=1 Tax=Pisolithus microcarpus 441 TaxID=765257 RepID=A0A0C9XLK9_9AGAM|nr:hypothetical protein PISMIDRAFT_411719 [Pisolithus microcarpus 441]
MSLLLNIRFRTVSKLLMVITIHEKKNPSQSRPCTDPRVAGNEASALSCFVPLCSCWRLDRFVLGIFRACVCSPRYKQDTLRSCERLYHLRSLQVCVL